MLLDTLLGVVELNVVSADPPEEERQQIERTIWWTRYGLHVCGATWIVPAALQAPARQRALGVTFGILLGGYSFVANRVPRAAMAPIASCNCSGCCPSAGGYAPTAPEFAQA
jgi:hypothetical protein